MIPSIEPDGKARVQWGTAENADTGTSGAAPGAGPSTGTAGAGAAFQRYQRVDATVRDWVQGTATLLGVDLAKDSMPQLFAQKQGYLVQITDGDLENAQVYPWQPVDPKKLAEARAYSLEQTKARIAGITARLALAHPALHPVIELHHPDEHEECQGCDGGPDYRGEWPCRTIELILEGLHEGDTLDGEQCLGATCPTS